MPTMKEEALTYEAPRTLNIADLEKIPVDAEIEDGHGVDLKGDEFHYKYITVGGQEYRVPGIVLGAIKAILEKKPGCRFVTVVKQGQGLATKYQVIPMD